MNISRATSHFNCGILTKAPDKVRPGSRTEPPIFPGISANSASARSQIPTGTVFLPCLGEVLARCRNLCTLGQLYIVHPREGLPAEAMVP